MPSEPTVNIPVSDITLKRTKESVLLAQSVWSELGADCYGCWVQ